ncbi:MAG: prepilin-type N-terminal cleavage/methylation domain-containing protein [Gallionella sp.]|nr:prepilin-type N-terminal cleavage/methylation domain-containing protein [Gallionella sp.]
MNSDLSPSCQSGFTLTELVMTIVIIGVLAVVVAPRFADNNVFQSRGFADQVQASLRYAQKVAIAQRHYACAAFTASQLALTIGTTPACGTALNLPAGSVNYINAPSGVTISPVPANFYFDALGKPSAGTSVVIGTTTITVEAETGYVHQ